MNTEKNNNNTQNQESCKYTFRKYQNFSAENHKKNLYILPHATTGCFAFVSKNEISDIEWYGLKSIIIDSFAEQNHYDIEFKICQGTYVADGDRVLPTNNYNAPNFINNVSSIETYFQLEDGDHVYYTFYTAHPRFKHNVFWRTLNPRKFKYDIIN